MAPGSWRGELVSGLVLPVPRIRRISPLARAVALARVGRHAGECLCRRSLDAKARLELALSVGSVSSNCRAREIAHGETIGHASGRAGFRADNDSTFNLRAYIRHEV